MEKKIENVQNPQFQTLDMNIIEYVVCGFFLLHPWRQWREGCQAHVLVQLLLGTNKSCHHAFGST